MIDRTFHEEGRNKTVLVTGARGFVGSAVLAAAAAGSLRRHVSLQTAFSEAGIDADARKPQASDLLRLSTGVAAVIHCSGNSSIRGSFEDPLGDLRSTLDSTYALLEFIRQSGRDMPLVYLSSSAVYGTATEASCETTALTPVSPYGLHKAMTEDLIRFYGRVHGVRAAILRPFSVIGAGQRKQLLWDALCRFQRGEAYFHGGADNVRDFIDVRDVAAFVPCALQAASTAAPAFNVSTGIGTTVREVIQLLARHYDGRLVPSFGEQTWPGDPKVLVGINTAARGLGWSPAVTLEAAVAAIVHWFQDLHKP